VCFNVQFGIVTGVSGRFGSGAIMYNRRSNDIIAAFHELEQQIERLHERCRKLELENRRLRGAGIRRTENAPAPQQKEGSNND